MRGQRYSALSSPRPTSGLLQRRMAPRVVTDVFASVTVVQTVDGRWYHRIDISGAADGVPFAVAIDSPYAYFHSEASAMEAGETEAQRQVLHHRNGGGGERPLSRLRLIPCGRKRDQRVRTAAEGR
jgi:hypothetical protein